MLAHQKYRWPMNNMVARVVNLTQWKNPPITFDLTVSPLHLQIQPTVVQKLDPWLGICGWECKITVLIHSWETAVGNVKNCFQFTVS